MPSLQSSRCSPQQLYFYRNAGNYRFPSYALLFEQALAQVLNHEINILLQIPIPGGYDKQRTIASFVGFGPVPDPQFVILIKLDRPQTSIWAVDTAAPAFGRLASRLFVVLDIPPEGAVVAEASR